MTQPLVSYVPLPAGDAGALATLHAMHGLVGRALADSRAVAVAHQLVGLGGDPDERIAAIRDFLETRFQFTYDPAPMDRVADPFFLLQEALAKGVVRGDCDDAAVLAAFLGAVAGLSYRFRAVGFRDHGPLSHVFTLLRGTQGFTSLDVTRNRSQVVPAARRVLDYP